MIKDWYYLLAREVETAMKESDMLRSEEILRARAHTRKLP